MSLDLRTRRPPEDIEKTSCDAPPLDFSFKNLRSVQELTTTAPRQGQRKYMHVEPQPEEVKTKKTSKEYPPAGRYQSQKEEEGQLPQPEPIEKKVDKKQPYITKLIPQNNIGALITTLVTSANLKNISGKNNDYLNNYKKRAVKIKLYCVSLVLGYNKLSSLMGLPYVLYIVMPNFSNLQWLDISHNHLEALDYDFKEMPKLRTLYMHCNYLYDMNNLCKLRHLYNLKTLTIHGNPLTAIPSFRIYLIEILPFLKKLDSVVISKKYRDNSRVWTKNIAENKYPIPKVYAKPPPEPQEKSDGEYP